jgi:hypothetical protein
VYSRCSAAPACNVSPAGRLGGQPAAMTCVRRHVLRCFVPEWLTTQHAVTLGWNAGHLHGIELG